MVLYYHRTTPDHVRQLFQGLFETFLYGRRDISFKKYPLVACPKCKYRQERAEVIKRIQAAKAVMFCGECGTRVPLPTEVAAGAPSPARAMLGAEEHLAHARTAFEAALTAVKGFVRDRGKHAKVSCFISYAWGDADSEQVVERIAEDLRLAGVDVILDRWDNARPGASVARFISRIESSDFIAVAGTPLYRRKYGNKWKSTGTIVAAEVDLISLRLTGTEELKATVLPMLVSGTPKRAFPPLLQGRVYSDFRSQDTYLPSLFDLILALYDIAVDEPAIVDARATLRPRSPTI
jgi:hypothetical protein